MFTQSTPSIINALSGALPPQAVRALVQALGNCQQPLTHRGEVSLSPAGPPNIAGVSRLGAWNPQQYTNLFAPNYQLNMEVPGGGGLTTGSLYNTNYGGAQFAFPTNQEFFANAYYGGPTFNVGGNSYFQNSYSTNATYQNAFVQNLSVTNVNGVPVGEQPTFGGGVAGDQYFIVEENVAVFISDDDQTTITGGRPRRRSAVTYVDVAGSVEIPYIYKAEIVDGCEVKLHEQTLTTSLDLRTRTDSERFSYLSPVSLEVEG